LAAVPTGGAGGAVARCAREKGCARKKLIAPTAMVKSRGLSGYVMTDPYAPLGGIA